MPPTLTTLNTTNETNVVYPISSLETSHSKPPNKGCKISMHKFIQKVNKSIRAKKDMSSNLTYEDAVNEELASLAMADAESPYSLTTVVVETLPST